MNADDKRILLLIGVSVVGLIIAFKWFGMIGVIIGLVACYFLFKGSSEANSSSSGEEYKSIDQRIAELEEENKQMRRDYYNKY